MSFTYSLVSDLHLDHPQPKTPPLETNVIVAGDCGNGLVGIKYLQKLQRKGHNVMAIDGNHEHYANVSQGHDIKTTEVQFYDQLGGETPLHRQVDDKLWVFGMNGWYPVLDDWHWKSYMSDGRLVGTAEQVNVRMHQQAKTLERWFRMLPLGHKAIVVTHTAPCEQSLDPKYDGNEGNQYYWSPAMEHVLVTCSEKITVWHHGHTHAGVDVFHAGVRIITNPRGYPGENPGWHPLTMEINDGVATPART